MQYLLFFFSELFILFALSKVLTTLLFNLFHHTTKNKTASIYLMSLFFLPGTLLHEMSHAFMAILLFVKVGRMELVPKLLGNNLKLGSVEIAKTDPLRRLLIGMGPFLFGTMLLIGIFFYAASQHLFGNHLFIAVATYAVFEIGNTMFSSRKDMEGALEVVLVFLVLSTALYLIGLRLPSFDPNAFLLQPLVRETMQKMNLYVAIPIGIDIVFILLFRMMNKIIFWG